MGQLNYLCHSFKFWDKGKVVCIELGGLAMLLLVLERR